MNRVPSSIYLNLMFLLVCSSVLFSQDFFSDTQVPRFGSLTRDDGLNSLSVSSIVQDKYGFLWFGSQGGLHRYNGKKMDVYTNDPFDSNSLPNDLVQTMIYDHERDCLWIGTHSGLSRYDLSTRQFTNYQYDPENPESLSNNVVVSLAFDDRGVLWVGTLDGLNLLVPGKTVFEKIEVPNNTIRSLLSDSAGRMWIGTYGGIYYWDFGKNEMISPEPGFDSTFVMSIKEPEPGRLLVGVWDGGVYEYWPDEECLKRWDVPDKRIYTVLESNDTTIWGGSWGGGLWAKSASGEEYYFSDTDSSELKNPVIYSLFQDRGGIVWLGTNGGGIHFLSPRRRNYRAYSNDDSQGDIALGSGKVNAISRTFDGILWVAVYGKGLLGINEETGETVRYRYSEDDPDSLSSDIVNLIVEDESGNLWLPTNNGLNYFDRKTGKFSLWEDLDFSPPPLSASVIYYIVWDRQGRMWIATYGGGVNRFDFESGEMKVFRRDPDNSFSIGDDLVDRILVRESGDIWISTNNGLSRYLSDEEGFRNYYHRTDDLNSLSANNVRDLFEDSKGRLWVGTYNGGLNIYHPETDSFTHFTNKEGMPSNKVVSIVEGDDGQIWTATSGGIAVVDYDNRKLSVIDERDGLFGVSFNSGNYKNDDGSIYFGGFHGITRVDTLGHYKNPHSPDIHITEVRVFEESLDKDLYVFDGRTLEFRHNENFISFDFVSLDYEAPRHNEHAYMMVGFDRDWIYSGSRGFANYTNLPSGKYEFKVKGSNNEALWNEVGASVYIIVQRPWYTRWWAFFLYIIGVFALVVLAWSLRSHQMLRKHNEELSDANTKLAEVNSKLGHLSVRDALTGLFNRRYFNEAFEREFDRAKREKSFLTVIMIDIDYFKRVNDTYGHLFGDYALKVVSGELQKNLQRKSDFISRYGGEEFAAVLWDMDREGAEMLAEKIRETINRLELSPWVHIKSGYKNQQVGISVSLGVVFAVPGREETEAEFLGKADEALYRAKSEGRNRVCFY